MNYKTLILPIIIALATTNDGMSALSKQSFPKSGADITFSQNIKLNTAGYQPYRDSTEYQSITIAAPTPKQNNNIQGTVNTNNNTTSVTTAQQNTGATNNNNNSNNNNSNNNNNSGSTPGTETPPPPSSSPQTGNNGSGSGTGTQNPPPATGRKACFSRDTNSAKRYVPPRVTNACAYWWIGDSRFTGMYINGIIGRPDNEAVVAHAGRGHEWFTRTPTPTGISLLETCLRDGDVVILNLGANDIWKHDAYISTYRNLMSKYPNVVFKVVSVNPVCDSKARLKNTKIETFNNHMKNAFAGNFIDTYSAVKPLVNESTTDSEGLHYRGGNIEQTIYNTIMQAVRNN
ncbi:MAG: hypothetical protein K2M34_02580 [Alphaproteobacteria bacterium]|nr:hypothetical protein [Alphaproteobacteria bacterium]